MSGDVTPESLRVLAERHKTFARVTISGDRARLHLDTADVLRQAADRITELEAALTDARATIAAAPHEPNCDSHVIRYDLRRGTGKCTCWKSAASGAALTARDAGVRAQALDDAAAHLPVGITTGEVRDWLNQQAKAIREGKGHND